MIKQQFEVPGKYKKWTYGLLAVGLVAFLAGIFLLGLSDDSHDKTRFWSGLLLNSLYFLMICNACMFFIAINILGHSSWQTTFRRIPEAISAVVPVFAVISLIVFIAIIFGHHHHIYHWIDKEAVANDKILSWKKGFLNPTFFFVWTVITLGVWILVGRKLRQLSVQTDAGEITGEEARRYIWNNTVWAGIFVVFFALTTGSTIPWLWLMSIDAHWYSTMYSWYTFMSSFVGGLSLIALFVVFLKNQGYLEHTTKEQLHDIGKYIFAFSIFWAYLWFSQFMLIWYANIPEETVYFKPRLQGAYSAIFWINFIINFIAPILILMTRGSKRNYTIVTYMAVVLVFGHWLDFYQMVMPGPMGDHYSLGWFEWGTLALFIGLLMFFTGRALTKANLVPVHHPYFKESLIHHT
ncbi:MAG TPA: quinol:cytochrome C oxidoreductase [Agriterribacter sp.]|nr:quinol:cytochrome C oxidoreductase [Chitinophagaceae bacterium]HRP32199.1 quinol:cytochrome C oxidoreductase [Agriterribacter sp.]